MMLRSRGVLLTGSTGLLGRYLLRDLLLANCRVSVLVRDAGGLLAAERIREIVDFWSETLQRRLPQPTVFAGDIREEGLGLSAADRRWLAVSCDGVVHSAASLSFRSTSDGEPLATNFGGTRHLLDLCRRVLITELHHVSTAFVCGESAGVVHEDDLERGQRFHNPYEESKCQAERLIRRAVDIRSTIYRPSVIVGDSSTGYTSSYHGLYRFVEFAARLAKPVVNADGSLSDRRRLDLRLPFTGNEPRNLIPVDWVSQAIVRIMGRAECHGRTYHLVASQPTPASLIKQVAEHLLNLEGVQFAGRITPGDFSSLERLFFDHLDHYEPYHQGDPAFDTCNLTAALPDFPAPRVDREMLTRLIEFAIGDQWGRGRSMPIKNQRIDCREYVEKTFPQAVARSSLARTIGLEVAVGLEVRGPAGGEWTLTWIKGELTSVCRGISAKTDVCYQISAAVFDDIVRGKLLPADAFFAQQIEVEGDLEKALKLAVLLGHFLEESATVSEAVEEECDALPRSV